MSGEAMACGSRIVVYYSIQFNVFPNNHTHILPDESHDIMKH
jgi:hypothetical protein